ncbi:hypothetical protein H311_00916 [Anncaliia algerae PRA109]|nr:hypothetical protein H311_00916 [Anncaliia algerae PRA109]
MRVIFYGRITKEELDIFLLNKPYSLINHPDLRKEITALNKADISSNAIEILPNSPQRFSNRNVLKDKNIFNAINAESKINYNKLLKLNTRKNTGYKNIKVFFKKYIKINNKKLDKLNTKVKFSDFEENNPHNNGEIKPILMCKTNNVVKFKNNRGKKKNVYILNHAPEDELSFEYEIRR